jgi:hypothetical protein
VTPQYLNWGSNSQNVHRIGMLSQPGLRFARGKRTVLEVKMGILQFEFLSHYAITAN